MKKKKSLLGLGLIALVLMLGVGYAIVSNEYLEIGGNVTAGGNVKVSFKSATDTSDKVEANTTDGSLTATIDVTNLETVGETVTATYVLQNKETDVDANVVVTDITVLSKDGKSTDLSEYFGVTTTIDEENGLDIEHDNTSTFDVVVELLKTPLTAETSTGEITIELTASAVVPNN